MKRTLLLLGLLTLAAASAGGCDGTPTEGRIAGECSDGADNDGNGLFDCADPSCAAAPSCAGVDAGAGGDAGPGRDAGPGVDAGGTSLFECCINGTGYRCPDDAAFDRCFGFDVDGCIEACAFDDFQCPPRCFDMAAVATPDPSACTADTTVTCEGGGGSCNAGSACDSNGDCASNNCSGGFCYDNAVGCLCDSNGDCDSNNCSGGMCRGNSVGDSCDSNGDCDSDNCSGGVCSGNGIGDACDSNGDCDSNNCSGGICRGN